MNTVLSTVAAAGSGLTAGVLLAVAVSLVPVFLSLPPAHYVRAHKVAGRYFDRFMPPTVVVTALVDVVLAVRTGGVLFAAAAAALVGVSVVSQFGNVPVNRAVRALPDGSVPVGWPDPRQRWQRLHWCRTTFALIALVLNLVAPASF
ncbi:DUF1772 domain-containing protein [Amycolatopsis balhimycina DSM 5908]|uniref:DUF1772 domain-containing protein n=1 Tax=Amycolatopsis balhimycina DSM 5908 TaxID=1081091 RepID=A0A428WPD0_AMYBA|nr:DUF1772 domain-containing protein [Amycolatopsis balhimycina]RSM44878.1 DUF1772 domain-containing protein [Amycolatopsis balhimycina DSM 5908]